jgi:signal peptidase II
MIRSLRQANGKKVWLPLGVFCVVVVLDQWSKTLVLRHIGLSERVDVVGPISFVRRYNTGVAFSLGNGSAITAWLVTVVVLALLVWVVRTISQGAEPLFVVLMAAIAGGGVGNQLDRLFRSGGWNKGAVIDFIDVGVFNFAIFNVADMALTVGCAVLAVWTLLGDGPAPPSGSGGNTKQLAPSSLRAASGDEGGQMATNTEASVSGSTAEGLRSEPLPEDAISGFPKSRAVDGREMDFSPSENDGAALPSRSSSASNESSTKGS